MDNALWLEGQGENVASSCILIVKCFEWETILMEGLLEITDVLNSCIE